ncbi:hypothetical protein [Halobacillus karajensis]|uniref:hypothetical protein n=1 Tax=Halobacillus karajensis TaxID=195088 RepID=UPI000A4C35D5|nr:hypothetical protein [Halobacillus karajensis]
MCWANGVNESVHEGGGKVATQLWHVGMTRSKGNILRRGIVVRLDGEKANETSFT